MEGLVKANGNSQFVIFHSSFLGKHFYCGCGDIKILIPKAIKTDAGSESEVDLDVKLLNKSQMSIITSKNKGAGRHVFFFREWFERLDAKRTSHTLRTMQQLNYVYDREQRPLD